MKLRRISPNNDLTVGIDTGGEQKLNCNLDKSS